MPRYNFPKDFWWGTATAAHQIEGNNTNSDWWAWENRDRSKDKHTYIYDKSKYPLEPSDIACDSYNRYEEDFDLCIKMNNNAVRIGIEWARIEPTQGNFDQKEIEHYKKVLQAAKNRGLKTFVTLFHFTSPKWLSEKGGWTNTQTPEIFADYAQKCAEEFKDLIDVYLTINEPQVYASVSYLVGRWPPQKSNPFLAFLVHTNLIRAHNKAYKKIKNADTNYVVGIVKNILWHQPAPENLNPLDILICKILYFFNTDFFLKFVQKNTDLLGINYYFTDQIKNFVPKNPNDKVSDLGWWLYPEGLKNILLNMKRYKLPIYITEHGLADSQDKYRGWYLAESLKLCSEAISEGVDLKGYFHWSLIDNYEWAEGFWPRFGLVEIDRKNNLKRIPRKSFYTYAQICKNGSIDS